MAKNDQEEAYDRLVSAALVRNIDLLKFAEAKNAALLTFCSAWILGSVNLLVTKSPLPLGYSVAFTVAIPFFAGAAAASLYSFVPKLKPQDFFKQKPTNPPLNLLFFGDMAKVSSARADEALRAAYMPLPDRSLTDRYAADLAAQLAINGKIAARKYGLFNMGAWFAGIAIVVLALPALGALIAGMGSKQ